MEKLFTLKQAAAVLAISPEFLKKLQRTGRVQVVHLGRVVRIPESEVRRLARDGVTR